MENNVEVGEKMKWYRERESIFGEGGREVGEMRGK